MSAFLPACVYVYYVHTWCAQRSEEGIRSPGTTELWMVVKHHVGAQASAKAATILNTELIL